VTTITINNFPIEDSWTFEVRFNDQNDEWTRSIGRWDTQAEAGKKAGEWIAIAAENGASYAVRVVSVWELALNP